MPKQRSLWAFDDGEASIHQTGLIVRGSPTVTEWTKLGTQIGKLRSGVQWAIGDWLLYGEHRGFDDGIIEAAAEATGLKRGTLMNLKSVAKTFPKPMRAYEVSWSHYALTAGFDDEQRGELLGRATTEHLSWDEMRGICQQRRQRQQREWQKFPEGTFGVIVAAPTWQKAPFDATTDRRAMSADAIMGLAPAVQGIAAPSCVLYLTVTNYRLRDAFDVLDAWGFKYATNHVITHELLGPGDWHRNRHDVVLVATRGVPVLPEEDRRCDSVVRSREELLQRLEYMYETGAVLPKVLLFDHDEREGWTVWGERLDTLAENAPTRGLRVRADTEQVIA